MIGLCGWHLVGLVSFTVQCVKRLFLVNCLMTFTNQEIHSGYPTRFASPYIMRLLKRGGLDYGVRLMKRDNEGLGEEEMSGVQMIKRGANEEEANGDYGIRIMRKRIPEVNEQRSSKIILWRGEPYSIEMPKIGGEDVDLLLLQIVSLSSISLG